jgi:Xaa-Pro dipeptidase
MPDFTVAELSERIAKLQEVLRSRGIDLIALNRNSDIYYYTGSVQPLYVIIPASDEPFILARKSITRISSEVSHIPLEAFSGSKDLTAILERRRVSKSAKAAYTLDVTSYATVMRFQEMFGEPEIADFSWDIRALRMVKSETEIAIQRRAGEIMGAIPDVVREKFRPGMTEIDLSADMEYYLRLKGHTALIRCRREGVEMSGIGLCSSGENSLTGTKFDGICGGTGITPAAAYGASLSPIVKGIPGIVDFAFSYEGYIVDQTRMFCWGNPPDEALRAYDAMVRVHRAVISNLRPGAVWQDLYEDSVRMAGELGYSDYYMGVGTERVRFVGHGVGLELDEPPFLAAKMKDKLAAGMVLAIEPKVAMPGLGIIGVEDTFVIRDGEPEQLTKAPEGFVIL